MAHAGQELFNPVTGQTSVFHQTAADTGGELLQVEWRGGPGWAAGPEHVHRAQEERFTVLAGRARSLVAGVERTHAAGEVFVARAGEVHTVANDADEELRLLVEFRPALRSEVVLETLAELARRGRVRPDGAPRNLFELALIVRTYERELYLASPPLWAQRLLLGPVAWLGRRLGYRAELPFQAAAGAAAPERITMAA